MFEFPGPGYEPELQAGLLRPGHELSRSDEGRFRAYDNDPQQEDRRHLLVDHGNGCGGYGEMVMGTKGTLVLEREQEVMLYKDSDTTTKVGVKDDKGGPTLDTQASGKGPSLAKAAAEPGPVSRGYTEEIEHWAWCIRNRAPRTSPAAGPKSPWATRSSPWPRNVAIDNANNGKGGYIAVQGRLVRHPQRRNARRQQREGREREAGGGAVVAHKAN